MAEKTRKPAKARKKTSKKQHVTLSEREQLNIDIRDECEAQLKIIQGRRIELESTGSFDPQLTSATNTLAKSIAVLSAEGRQLDKHRDQAVVDLPADQEDSIVRDFLTDISPARRSAFRDFLAEADPDDQLLGHG